MTFLSAENLSKNYGVKKLFEGITFGISKGDKAALVAPNGTGKSTLLKVLAGREVSDTGTVTTSNDIRIGFLEQEPNLQGARTIQEYIHKGNSATVRIIQNYEEAARAQAETFNEETQKAFERAMADMDAANAWGHEQRMKQILGKLDIHNLDQSVDSLSGGERKRVALAFVLLESPDLLLLDEPTNHLDLDMIEWLEKYLAKNSTALLMVTHDRYFLDRICNRIIEIDQGKIYHHQGNYEYYLQKRSERHEIEEKEVGKAGQLLKKELEWMRRAPKARTGKSKSRIGAFYQTQEKAEQTRADSQLRLDVNMSRMGSKILELSGIQKRYDDTIILDDFSYSFNRGERIGIIGANGAGKSTFLNVITGEEPADAGDIDKGSTIVYGHYHQQGIEVDENQRVIDVLKEIAEVIELANGRKVSASQFLEHFMFPKKMQYTQVSKLSGGERRRLGLMMVLIKNPNFLILDEPTNDLDLMTLNRLEEFLLDFGGCLILVSHDRFFMDKLVDHYFIFEGNGRIRDFQGTYQEYRLEQSQLEQSQRAQKTEEQNISDPSLSSNANRTGGKGAKTSSSGPGGAVESQEKKRTHKEQKEYQQLEKEIEQLEKEKSDLEAEMSGGHLDPEQIRDKSTRYGELEKIIDEKSLRWLELAEKE